MCFVPVKIQTVNRTLGHSSFQVVTTFTQVISLIVTLSDRLKELQKMRQDVPTYIWRMCVCVCVC